MDIKTVWRCARAAVIELDDGGLYDTFFSWEVYVNGQRQGTTKKVETYVDGLVPGTRNVVKFVNGDEVYEAGVTTPQESATIDVRDCGAKGDGKHDDTVNIQAAIMACPKDGRVLVPAGKYLVKSLFLKSGCSIELQEGSQILARHDRDQLAYIPGTLKGTEGLGKDATDLFPLGRWEGESISTYCSLFTGLSVHDVNIYGRGTIDGQTDFADDNWWHNVKDLYRPEEGRDIARPRMVFLSECSHVALAGITVQNSPAWNIHPVMCDHFDALCLAIKGPKNSHNTDGCDPESCSFVRILGCEFSVGDDCIAIKSGKLGIDRPLRPATHDMLVAPCLMHDGHGAVVLGSEAAGGIKDLVVRDCDFRRTDRGLRVKTRRGRGNDAVNEGILFENIHMDHVLTPFVVNAFYFCDKDGKTDYVQSRKPLPVDERTPGFGMLEFRDIVAENCQVAAAWITGLPERKISELVFDDVKISFDPDAEPGVPAMASGVEAMARKGIIAQNVERLVLRSVTMEGQDGDELVLDNVDEVVHL